MTKIVLKVVFFTYFWFGTVLANPPDTVPTDLLEDNDNAFFQRAVLEAVKRCEDILGSCLEAWSNDTERCREYIGTLGCEFLYKLDSMKKIKK